MTVAFSHNPPSRQQGILRQTLWFVELRPQRWRPSRSAIATSRLGGVRDPGRMAFQTAIGRLVALHTILHARAIGWWLVELVGQVSMAVGAIRPDGVKVKRM